MNITTRMVQKPHQLHSKLHIPAAPHEAIRRPSSSIYASAGENVHKQIQGELQLLANSKS